MKTKIFKSDVGAILIVPAHLEVKEVVINGLKVPFKLQE